MRFYPFLFIFCLAMAFLAPPSLAAQRKIYFTQAGQNATVNGLSSTAQSTCTISIRNSSSVSETFILSVTANASGTGAGAATNPAGNTTVPYSTGTVTIASGLTQIYTFTYVTFPASTVGSQVLVCSGSITADDSAAGSPGYLVASGKLVTFVESGTISSSGTTAGSSVLKNFAVYTQLPITINGGRPF